MFNINSIKEDVMSYVEDIKAGFSVPTVGHEEEAIAMATKTMGASIAASAVGTVVGVVGGLVTGAGVLKAIGIGVCIATVASIGAVGYVAVTESAKLGKLVSEEVN
jgi:hypothetical protein